MWSDKQLICFYSIGTCGGKNRRSLWYLRNAVGRSADLYWDTLRDHSIRTYSTRMFVPELGPLNTCPARQCVFPLRTNYDDGTETLVLYVLYMYYNLFTLGHVEGRAANYVRHVV